MNNYIVNLKEKFITEAIMAITQRNKQLPEKKPALTGKAPYSVSLEITKSKPS